MKSSFSWTITGMSSSSSYTFICDINLSSKEPLGLNSYSFTSIAFNFSTLCLTYFDTPPSFVYSKKALMES